MEDLLASELAIVVQNLINDKRIVVSPVSKSDMRTNIYNSNSGKNLNEYPYNFFPPFLFVLFFLYRHPLTFITLLRSPSLSSITSNSPSSSTSTSPNSFEAKPPPTINLDQPKPLPPQQPLPPLPQQPLPSLPQQPQTEQNTQSDPKMQVAAHAHALALAQMQAKQAIAQAQMETQTSQGTQQADKKLDSQGQTDAKTKFTPVRSPTSQAQPQKTPPTEALLLNEESEQPKQEGSSPGGTSSSPSSPSPTTSAAAQPNKVYGTVFGTHRMRPRSPVYSASAPIPTVPNSNPAPARAHNNTSPAAVDPSIKEGNREGENGVHEPVPLSESPAKVLLEKEKEKEKEREKDKEMEILAKEKEGKETKAIRGSGEIVSGNTTRRPGKAYTFFSSSAANKDAPTIICECGKEQKLSDRFCAGCGKKR